MTQIMTRRNNIPYIMGIIIMLVCVSCDGNAQDAYSMFKEGREIEETGDVFTADSVFRMAGQIAHSNLKEAYNNMLDADWQDEAEIKPILRSIVHNESIMALSRYHLARIYHSAKQYNKAWSFIEASLVNIKHGKVKRMLELCSDGLRKDVLLKTRDWIDGYSQYEKSIDSLANTYRVIHTLHRYTKSINSRNHRQLLVHMPDCIKRYKSQSDWIKVLSSAYDNDNMSFMIDTCVIIDVAYLADYARLIVDSRLNLLIKEVVVGEEYVADKLKRVFGERAKVEAIHDKRYSVEYTEVFFWGK